MKNLTSLVVALLVAAGSLQAEQIFILFDGTCGDRVLYEQSVNQQPATQYYAYHFGFVGGDRLMLETGAEGSTVQNYLPQNYLYCGDPRLTPDLARRVNAGTDRAFILLPLENNQFLIQPVVMAATLQRRGAEFAYQSPLTNYAFDMDNGIIGENLARGGKESTSKVYFEGRETSPCTGIFLFRQLEPGASYPVIDAKVAPELGIYERRLGSDGLTNTGGVIVAKEVNGMPVNQFLQATCGQAAIAGNAAPAPQPAAPTGYSNQQPAPVNPYANPAAQPESQAYAQNNPQPVAPVTTVTHTVQRGETLYAVSRKYGATVDDIKAMNGLSSNTLFPGQQLSVRSVQTAPIAQVSQVNPPAGNAVAMNPNVPARMTVPTTPYNAGSVANSNPGAAQPTPYQSAPAAPQAYGTQQSARGTSVYGEDTHVVQPGETVASIALKYGYTSAKFREINELGPAEIVKVGQQMKTTSCNCPAPAPVEVAAPAAYGQPAPATPQAYGQPAPAANQPYTGQTPAAPQPYGQTTAPQQPAPAFRTPQGYQAPAAAPVPAATTPRSPAPTTITNNPNFGQAVPNPGATPTATMGQLERQATAAPATPGAYSPGSYNSRPAPAAAPQTAPPAYGGTAPAPATYGSSPQPVTSSYGTPVGAATAPPAVQPSNRSFHLVQEGDSLFSIARRYGISTDELRALNGLTNSSVIVPFQKLYVN